MGYRSKTKLECMANAQLVGSKLRVLFFRRLWIKVHLVMSKVSKVVIRLTIALCCEDYYYGNPRHTALCQRSCLQSTGINNDGSTGRIRKLTYLNPDVWAKSLSTICVQKSYIHYI